MNNKSTITTRKIVITALMAALTVAGSAIRVTMPIDIAGTTSFHLGNIMCALSGLLLGPWFGGLAAGLGSAIYDIMNPLYISECWITFLTKGAYGLVAGLIAYAGVKNWGYIKAVLASLGGAVTYAALYLAKSYFYSGLLIKGLTPDAALLTIYAKLPATIFNAVVAIIFAPILGIAIRKALEANHIEIRKSRRIRFRVRRLFPRKWNGSLARKFPPSYCRGGYHPPAQWSFPTKYLVGRIRTMPGKEPFNQTRCRPTWREADSLPYIGWVIIAPPNYNFL